MDKSSTPQKNVVKMERDEAVETKEVNFLSFSCKNIKTIGPFLHHHHNKIDILPVMHVMRFCSYIFRISKLM
jgi:hypothetical protein